MSSLTELFLYAAARCQHVGEVIKPALKEDKIVLCDRFADATSAYQGTARSIDKKFLTEIHQLATDNLKPNLTILIDCPVEIGLQRALERQSEIAGQSKLDRLEKESTKFHEKVREGYLKIAHEEPQRVKVINGMDDIETVHQKVVEEVMKLIK